MIRELRLPQRLWKSQLLCLLLRRSSDALQMALNQNSCGRSSRAGFVSGRGSCKGRNNSDPLQCSQGFLVIIPARQESWAHAGIGVSSLQPLEEQWLVVDVSHKSWLSLDQSPQLQGLVGPSWKELSSTFCLLSLAVGAVGKRGNCAIGEPAFAVVVGIAKHCLY